METKYRIFIENNGGNRVKVAENTGPNTYKLVWMFGLDGKDEPVVLHHFYSPTQFLIMDWHGDLRACDAEKKEIIFRKDFKADLDCRARISRDGTKLYVSHSTGYKNTTLTVLSLDDLSTAAEHPLPKPIDLEYVRERGDGKLLYYYLDWTWGEETGSDRRKVWTHGYQVVDPATGANQNHVLPGAPTDNFETKPPVLDIQRNLGVFQDWDGLEVSTGPGGEPRFTEKLTLFDLDSFTVLRKIPVREYQTSHLTCFEQSDEETAAALIKGPGTEEYDEAVKEVMENLNSVRYTANEDALWLCWRAGVVRKVSLDGSWRSPLLAAAGVPGYRGDMGPFGFRTFHTYLKSVHDDHLVLQEHGRPMVLSLVGIDLNSDEEFIPVTLSELPEDQKINIITPRGFARQMEEMGKAVIKVDDLTKAESVLEALDRIGELTEDIGSIRDGWKLIFLVRDKKGKKRHDDKFFREAVKVEGALGKIRRIIENFASYPGAEGLYIDEEAAALCYAAHFAGLADPGSIDTALRYLSVIDFEHDVYCQENLIPGLIEKYGDTKYGPRLRIGIAMTDAVDAADTYLFEEYLNSSSPFRKWFDKGGSREIPGIVDEMLALGLMTRSIFEYAPAGLERLQAAFEGEEAEAAEKAVLQGLDPDLLGWNYLKHVENPEAGHDLAGNDLSGYDEPHLRLLAFAGLANMLLFRILEDDEHVAVLEVEHPRVKKLLPDPVVFRKVGGLMHRVEGEEFLRLPGLMQFGGMEFFIDYLTSTKISPEDAELFRRESWNMDPADVILNLPGIGKDRLEDILFFMQPPFHSTKREHWSDWLIRMKFDSTLEPLTRGMLKQLADFALKLAKLTKKLDFLNENEVEDFREAVKSALHQKSGEPETPPDFSGFIRINMDGSAGEPAGSPPESDSPRKAEDPTIFKPVEKEIPLPETPDPDDYLKYDITGRKICFTGKAPVSRSELTELLTSRGSTVQKSVGKTTDLLLCSEEDTGSSKAVSARELGIPIIIYTEIIDFDTYNRTKEN